MKIRQGFVSNSSSSSFIMRAVKFGKEELIEALNFTEDEIIEANNDDYDFYELVGKRLRGTKLCVQNTGNYFGSNDYANLIIGQNIGELPDGEVVEIDDVTTNDSEILTDMLSLGLNGTLKTYVQMVSNDNY